MWEDFYQEWHDWLNSSERVSGYWNDKNKTWKDAKTYSKLIGDKSFELFQKHFGIDYEGLTEEQILEMCEGLIGALSQGYSATAYYTKQVMTQTLDNAKVSIRAIEPAYDISRATNLKDKVIAGSTELISKSTFQNNAYSAVTDTIQANSRFDDKAGLQTQLIRDSGAGCCDWCESKAGIFQYGEQPDGFWQVHKDCTCTLEYHVGKTHTRITYKQDEKGKLRKNTEDI